MNSKSGRAYAVGVSRRRFIPPSNSDLLVLRDICRCLGHEPRRRREAFTLFIRETFPLNVADAVAFAMSQPDEGDVNAIVIVATDVIASTTSRLGFRSAFLREQ
jgi:hypothetical protein